MTTAAEVVAIQADVVAEFHRPDPQRPGAVYTARSSSGGEYSVPRSLMGDVVCSLTRTSEGTWSEVVPIVARGISRARAYRVQENMTAPIMERAHAMRGSTRALYDIEPPRPQGWVWFEEPPAMSTYTNGTALNFSALSWVAVADGQATDATRLTWIVLLWGDTHSRDWSGFGTHRGLPRVRMCPLGVRLITAGDPVGGRQLPAPESQAMVIAEGTDGVTAVFNPDRIVMALWEMLGETLPARDDGATVDRSTEPIDRADARRARARGVAASEVTTVVLRRQQPPVRNPGSGRAREWRVWVEPYTAHRWVGSERRGDRRRVVRTIAGHWSAPEDLPVRRRTIVSELRR